MEFLQYLHDIWSGFGSETKSALLNGGATISAAILGVGALILQIRSQGRQSRSSLKENERLKLKAQMFEESVLLSRVVSEAAIALSTKLRTFGENILFASTEYALDGNGEKIRVTVESILDLYGKFSNNSVNFIYHIEKYRIIDSRILVFRAAASSVLHDCREHHSKFFTEIMPLMPQRGEAQGAIDVSPDLKAAAEEWASSFLESLNEITAYMEDFLVEMQNLLLGDLFEKNSEHRKPLDPSKKVITLAEYDALTAWFEHNTEWGKVLQQYENPELAGI